MIAQWHNRRHGRGPVDLCWKCTREQWQCKRKQSFQTADDARAFALEMNVRRDWPERLVIEYRCRVCACWHITTATKTRALKRLRRRRLLWLATQEHGGRA